MGSLFPSRSDLTSIKLHGPLIWRPRIGWPPGKHTLPHMGQPARRDLGVVDYSDIAKQFQHAPGSAHGCCTRRPSLIQSYHHGQPSHIQQLSCATQHHHAACHEGPAWCAEWLLVKAGSRILAYAHFAGRPLSPRLHVGEHVRRTRSRWPFHQLRNHPISLFSETNHSVRDPSE